MIFEPIVTRRLILQPPHIGDAEALWVRRNHPQVARYQTWQLPYPRERAEALLAEMSRRDGPVVDDWWMVTVCDRTGGAIVADLVVKLEWEGRSAEIGYTFHPDHWGRGLAVEATEALVRWLFETVGVSRISGMLHPDNPASAMVLERVGMIFEGHTRCSFWVGDDNSDDWLYGMTRDDWVRWVDRPRQPPHVVELIEIGRDNHRDVARLVTHHSQTRFVAPVTVSYGDALFSATGAWMRAVIADGEPVGFVMVAFADGQDPHLWRLLVERLHQRRGIGRRVVEMVIAECRLRGAKGIVVRWVPGKGSPEPFFRALGFEPTGEMDGLEVGARLPLG